MIVDGITFWNRVDEELSLSNRTIRDMSNSMDIVYGSLIDARKRKSIPKIEIICKIATYLGLPIERLVTNKSIPQNLKRIDAIRRACLIAPEEDLKLVERILRIDSSRSAKQFTFTESAKI